MHTPATPFVAVRPGRAGTLVVVALLLCATTSAAAQTRTKSTEKKSLATLSKLTGSGGKPSLVDQLVGTPKLSHLSRIGQLLIPVEGVRAERLRDTYTEGRSGGRTHHAIDIHAPRGTPVLAAAPGKIIKLDQGKLGGLSIYHLDDNGETRYYYAHLDRYAEGLAPGQRVDQGQVIGYVGDTGNAAPGDFHLHFSVALLRDSRRWWEGINVNPFALLTGGRSVRASE